MKHKIFQHQLWHLLAVCFAIVVFYFFTNTDSMLTEGSLFGVKTFVWLWIALLTPILHQLYVFIVWRYELYTEIFTQKFGLQKAFKLYSIGFSILFVMRLITIVLLALSNRYTLDVPSWYLYSLALILLPFILYLFYSVIKYFTVERAYGIDHFDKNYDVPFVKQGIFKYTDNGMYVIGLAVLYLPGLLLFSKAAIVIAFFNHIYIWVHYYTVEKPDMEYIYGKTP